MKIAVLSGKGGTGKTLISVNIAAVASNSVYMDFDVEEPNGHLFFQPDYYEDNDTNVLIPVVNQDLCTGCRKCVDFCRFNALAYVSDKLMVFNEICHSCGGCSKLCPHRAIHEEKRKIGHIQKGLSENIAIISGFLKEGEVSGVPLIKQMNNMDTSQYDTTIIDCPPGSACTVMESIRIVDYCLLITEPTIFGVHNLEMVYELVNLFKKPFSVILNKVISQENPSEQFCKKHNIRILGRIPYSQEIGNLNSDGKILARHNEDYHNLFSNLLSKIKEEVSHQAITHS